MESGKETDSLVGGILCFRGGNVFDGYWHDEDQTNAVFDADGFFKTGDWADWIRMVLWIEGRISRFSKIGGEMVSHQMIEEAITHVLDICPGQDLPFVVTAREHEQKGEEIILISTLSLDLNQIQKDLGQMDYPISGSQEIAFQLRLYRFYLQEKSVGVRFVI